MTSETRTISHCKYTLSFDLYCIIICLMRTLHLVARGAGLVDGASAPVTCTLQRSLVRRGSTSRVTVIPSGHTLWPYSYNWSRFVSIWSYRWWVIHTIGPSFAIQLVSTLSPFGRIIEWQVTPLGHTCSFKEYFLPSLFNTLCQDFLPLALEKRLAKIWSHQRSTMIISLFFPAFVAGWVESALKWPIRRHETYLLGNSR